MKRCCSECGKLISTRYKGKHFLCDECRDKEKQGEALARFADQEMFGDEADYHEAAGLEFGNK